MEIEEILFITKAKSAYTCGSSLILDNPKDNDVVLFFENEELKRNGIVNAPHDTGYDLHFSTNNNKVFISCYSVHFMNKIAGEDIELTLDIFEEETREKYVKLLKNHVSLLKNENKNWYHILTAVYMYDNGSYDLTKKQKKTIQEVHDKGITEKLKNYCIEKLQ